MFDRVTRRWACLLLVLSGLGALAPCRALRAQEADVTGRDEVRLLREASAREASGDHEGAERVLRSILATRPTAVTALVALERVLRVQGRLDHLLPLIDDLLEQEPESALGNQMRIRVLSELNRLDELEAAAESWIEATPRIETPYREIARVWAARGDHARALRVLERGRSRVGRKDALALELGETYARLGDPARAIPEWDRAIGAEGRGYSLVRRRLAALPDGGAGLVEGLIAALTREPSSTARRRAAADLAISSGLGARAEAIARQVLDALPEHQRAPFLVEMARRAEGAALYPLAYWAYGALLEVGGEDAQSLAVRSRLAELALVVGDTASAMQHFRVIEQASATGSAERRYAIAVRIELTARDGDIEEAIRELESFRTAYGDPPEIDALTAAIADVLLGRGEVERAERVVGNVTGPRTYLVRGRIALGRGDVAGARHALLAAASGLDGPDATEALALVTLLGRIGAGSCELLSRAVARAMQGDTVGAITILVDESEGLVAAERAAVLDFAAGLADRARLPAEAESIRRTIVTNHPGSREAPAALLALGRSLAGRPDGIEEARHYLERLVLEHPRSALAPQARRELDRLQGRTPR